MTPAPRVRGGEGQPQRVGAEPSRGRAGAKARTASSTVHDQGVRSSSVRSAGAGASGARTSHSFHTAPPPAGVSTSKRRSGQSGTGHCHASQSRSPTRRGARDSGSPSTERYRDSAGRGRGERTIACQRRLASRMSAREAPSARRASSTGPGLWSAMRRSSTNWKWNGVNGSGGRRPEGT